MKSPWRIAVPVVCALAISGAAIAWHLMKQKKTEEQQAQDARSMRVRAEQGDAKAEYDLSQMYYHGIGVPRDYAETLRWSSKAAGQKYPAAYFAIGYLYEQGQGVAQDFAAAAGWYQKGADKGFARAQGALGRMYSRGLGVPRDFSEALRWRQMAAAQGDPAAEDGLAYMYHHGQGVPQDDAEAMRWYRKAADQGHAEGQSGVGFMYFYGYGVRADHAEAYSWFRRAADQGDAYAQQALSKKFTSLNKVYLVAQGLLGILLSLNFLSLNIWERGEGRPGKRQGLITGTGLLCLFSAGLSWYGYTHYKIRCLRCGFNSFTWISWSLDGVALALLFFIVLSEKAGAPRSDPAGQ